MPAVASRIALAACALLAPVVAIQAASMDAPKRKPGLWQQTVTTTGLAVAPQSMSMCSDEKTDDLIASRAGRTSECVTAAPSESSESVSMPQRTVKR